MTDIHCHLLFGIDDGAKSLEQSVDILADMKENGYNNVILTPHFIQDSKYASTRKNNQKILNELRNALKERKIDINLYLGNEIFIDYNILELLNKGIISSLNDTNYLLIELPMSGEFEAYEEVFRELINNGYQVILAHPERYLAFQKDFNKIYELEKLGVYFQSNLDSIIGGYGKGAIKMVKRLLKEKKISFLATDIHHKKSDYSKWAKAHKKALKYLSEKEFMTLVDDNPSKLIDL